MKPVHIGIALAGGFFGYQLYQRYRSGSDIGIGTPVSSADSPPQTHVTGKNPATLPSGDPPVDPASLYLPDGAFAMRASIGVDTTPAMATAPPPPIPPAKIPPPGFKPPPPPTYKPVASLNNAPGVVEIGGRYYVKTSSGGARPHGGTGAPASGTSTGGDAEHAGKVFV